MNEMPIEQALTLAMQCQQAGKLAEAEALYRRVLAAQPNQPDALHMLGLIAANVGRLDLAEQLIRGSIAVRPDLAKFHFNLGIVLGHAGKVEAAIQSYRAATRLDPGYPGAWYNLANALQAAGQIQPAVEAYQAAIRIDPDYCDAQVNLGAVLQGQNQFTQAIETLEKALQLQPDLAEAHNNLARALTEIGQSGRAIASCRRAIELKPDYAEAHNNLASALLSQGQFDQAAREYHRAVELKPDYALAHCNLGMQMLLHGDFENGWREFEWRSQAPELGYVQQNFSQPRWDGSKLNGQRVLVHAEQGLGDTIQFARYVPLVRQMGGSVILQCQDELATLLASLDGVENIVRQHDALPTFDLHCPLLSLPQVFGTRLTTIPSQIPYLRADPSRAMQWRERIKPFQDMLKVGIAWAGRKEHRNDRNRSMAETQFEPLSKVGKVQLFSLQKGGTSDPGMTDWTNELADFSDTAALIESLDLVIAVDTAVVHLAGALGRPVWVLLPFVPDWRWLLERQDSPWYPTMQLIRQPKPGDWDSAIQRAAEMLGQFSSQ